MALPTSSFAGCYQTGRVLLFDLLDFLLCSSNQGNLLWRYQHVIYTDRDTGTSRQTETGLHQLIGKHNRGTQTALAE
jgi:hypothetical protein